MLYLPILVSVFSLVFTYFLAREIRKTSSGSGKQVKIAQAIREGTRVFLKRQYLTIGIVAIFLFFLLSLALGLKVAFSFLIGVVASGLAVLIGMLVSNQANLKVTEAAKSGLKEAFDLVFKSSLVTGFLVGVLALLVVAGLYFLFNDLKTLIALAFGSSLVAVFARLGGGIYTKAADVGADLVRKIEKGISEDDPRNLVVIADQVGNSVVDSAGVTADLFQAYLVTVVAAMILGALIFPGQLLAVILPLYLAALAVLASIISTYFVKLGKRSSSISSLYKGLILAAILSAIGFWPIISQTALILNFSVINLYLSAIIGFFIVGGMFLITNFFTSKKYWSVKSIAEVSQSGYDSNIITSLAIGMKLTIWPMILISIAILISFGLAGIYGLAITGVTMLSLAGLIIALDSYGLITNNVVRIVEMSDLPEEVRKNTDALDAISNTTKATTKGYAIVSAGLAALVLFFAYSQELLNLGKKVQFVLEDPEVLVGLFFGGIITYYFAVLAMSAVGKSAGKVVEEARRQFREIPGLMEDQVWPEYSKCVDIITKVALKEMILPALLPVLFPILIGFTLGLEALGGLLIGSIIVGIFLAISMTFGGVAWDNAKKYIKEGNLEGKESFTHQIAITGETMEDGFKNSAGLAINPMLKVLNIVALLIISFLL